MRRLNRALVAGFVVAGTFVICCGAASAQINGAPPSVTSIGFGGTPGSIHGTASSVTSLGPRGYTPGNNPFPHNSGLFGTSSGNNINGHGGHGHPPGYYPWGGGYYYAVPYYGYGYDDGSGPGDPQADDQYNGGPTVFDRRGPGSGGPGPANAGPVGPGPTPTAAPAPSASQMNSGTDNASAPAVAQPETVLVFKDGHQLDVENYAIVGNTLWDLTDGRRHKIELDELDLTATAKQNEDRGVDFQIPATSAAN
ncbi:MAG TPA: hypothetical protein VF753_00390 [Terriglobales bacterium]